MTMAVGFVCWDGIVIGADRQVTGHNYTFPECKLEPLVWKNGRAILAYSGEYDAYKNFLSELSLRFKRDAVFSDKEVRDALRESLSAVDLKKETLLFLFGYLLDGAYHRLIFSTTKQRIVDVDQCEVIGYADSPLTRFLLGRFKALPVSVSVDQARIYAVYFISQAKKYDGQYVGDGIDVYSLERGSEGPSIRVLDAGQTGEWEQQVNLIQYWMDVLFNFVSDRDRDVSLEQFMERLEGFREWVGGTPLKLSDSETSGSEQ